ncbi:winged helix-turn-helix transcriptional regulator [Streptococcus peroris]|nr:MULTISPECIES: winged helix-turn-helix transcriptional regulator [Streptococcus]MDO6229013.1 winged helix-turn-helix transcriptional regulator [Streptococcus infantis]
MTEHTEYELTGKGKSLMPILKDLNQWGKEWLH